MLPLIIFIVVPLAEIAMFMVVGDLIGFWPTLGLVVITALIGTTLLRQQGLSVLSQAQSTTAEGKIPINSVMDGLFLLVAGAFLLTPGILTDIVGFSFMIPSVRRLLGTYLYKKFSSNISFTSYGFESQTFDERQTPFRDSNAHKEEKNKDKDYEDYDGPIIDGEIIPPKNPNPDSPWHKK